MFPTKVPITQSNREDKRWQVAPLFRITKLQYDVNYALHVALTCLAVLINTTVDVRSTSGFHQRHFAYVYSEISFLISMILAHETGWHGKCDLHEEKQFKLIIISVKDFSRQVKPYLCYIAIIQPSVLYHSGKFFTAQWRYITLRRLVDKRFETSFF